MTRKDYELIADAIKHSLTVQTILSEKDATNLAYRAGFVAGIEQAASDIADALKLDNGRFDTERFIRACGVQS